MTCPSSRHRAAGRVPVGALVLAAVGLAWAATMTRLAVVELADGRRSEDVRALVEAARLEEAHASARYEIRLGDLRVGEISSTVSGGQRDDQLAYVITGRLTRPQRASLQGFVLADWQRRPARFVLEATLEGQRHRIEGGLAPRGDGGVLFEARHVPPGAGAARSGPARPARSASWVLPESPVLAPGPLPLPELSGLAAGGGASEGRVADPLTGAPTRWAIEAAEPVTFVLGGRERPAVRRVLVYGDQRLEIVTEASGFPLAVELPLGVRVVLVEEKR